MDRHSLLPKLVLALALTALIWWAVQDSTEQKPAPPSQDKPAVQQQEQASLEGAANQAQAEPQLIRDLQPSADDAPIPIKTRFGSLSGQLILADEGPIDSWDWKVRIEGPGKSWPMNEVKLQADGAFHAEGLEPGSYDAIVERERLPIARVEQIIVVAQRETKDPRINPWNPEEASREMRIEITGRPGNRGNTNVWAIEGQGEILGHARWEGKKRILQCAAGQAPDVVIIAPGYQPKRIPWQDGDVSVTLEAGIKVELQATAAVQMDPDIKRGWFVLQPEFPLLGIRPGQFSVGFSATDLIAGKVVSLRLPTAGSYILRFDGDVNDGPGFMPLYLTVVQRGIVVPEPGDDLPPISIVLPNPLKNDPQ